MKHKWVETGELSGTFPGNYKLYKCEHCGIDAEKAGKDNDCPGKPLDREQHHLWPVFEQLFQNTSIGAKPLIDLCWPWFKAGADAEEEYQKDNRPDMRGGEE